MNIFENFFSSIYGKQMRIPFKAFVQEAWILYFEKDNEWGFYCTVEYPYVTPLMFILRTGSNIKVGFPPQNYYHGFEMEALVRYTLVALEGG